MSQQPITRLPPSTPPQVSPFEVHFYDPQRPLTGTYVPSFALESRVQAFILLHRIRSRAAHTPRTCLIQGEPGIGKTETALRAALACNTIVGLAPPSLFASKHEGGGVDTVTAFLSDLQAASARRKLHAVAIFDDIDHSILAVGKGDNVGRTVNTSDAVGSLQNWSSNRSLFVSFDGSAIPFLATANAADQIAPSLFRNMRATIITHRADEATKHELARTLFKPRGPLERRAFDKLFAKYRKEPIAFWPALLSECDAKRVEKAIGTYGCDVAAIEHILAKPVTLDVTTLFELAETMRSARPGNFLWKRYSA